MTLPTDKTAATAFVLETERLCFGCDSPLGPDRYCASCEDAMPTYPWVRGETATYARHPSRIERLLGERM